MHRIKCSHILFLTRLRLETYNNQSSSIRSEGNTIGLFEHNILVKFEKHKAVDLLQNCTLDDVSINDEIKMITECCCPMSQK